MKKNILTIAIALIGVLAIVGMVYASHTMKQEEKELDKHLISLNYETLKEKIENKETFILVVTASECGHCNQYKPTLKKVLKEHELYAYEIQNDKLDKEGINFLNSVATISGTPTTVFIVDGAEYSTMNRIVGNTTKDKIESRLKTMGYIK